MSSSRIPPERLAEVERRLLRAEAPADFVPELAKEWGRSKRRVWDYVARVRARLAERAKAPSPEADREIVRAMLLNAYRKAETGSKKGPDARGMVQAAKTYADVTGVLAPRRLEITGRNGGPVEIAGLSDEELDRRIAELEAQTRPG